MDLDFGPCLKPSLRGENTNLFPQPNGYTHSRRTDSHWDWGGGQFNVWGGVREFREGAFSLSVCSNDSHSFATLPHISIHFIFLFSRELARIASRALAENRVLFGLPQTGSPRPCNLCSLTTGLLHICIFEKECIMSFQEGVQLCLWK